MTSQMCNRQRAAVAVLVFAIAPLARAQVAPDETVKSFQLADGLEATVWATEPMLVNPTNIDIDARGRIWVCEGANYRSQLRKIPPTRPEGDRIVILEDTDHDGKADSEKVFAQGPELASPLGIAVIGDKVYVSQSPNIWVYTIDASGDKPAGRPEIWMTGFEGVDHDHGVHAIVFGPDGRLYFNAGNDGCSAKQPFEWGNGKDVVDVTNSHVPRGPLWRGGDRPKDVIGYQQGMAFRCNADGSGFEVLGHNFRNNYELAVDSFGTVWQSDNDDDGNEGVRLNYVMEGGDFGYHGPKGYDWNRDQGAFPGQSRQEAHWHQRWPGVVPNLIHTGGGSPTGIVVYEGELLPERYRGALIHCEPGANVVRAYIPKPSAQVPVKKYTDPDAYKGPDRPGAGYKADVVDLVKGKDNWFRPSDVCVAPDGSIFIADWYDPGVGGHQTADPRKDEPQDWRKLRGRIYRAAPKGNKSAPVKLDLSSVDGQITALKSPNVATRARAFMRLRDGGNEARRALTALSTGTDPQRYRARAVWLLARGGFSDVANAFQEGEPDMFVTVLRAMRFAGSDLTNFDKIPSGAKAPRSVLREVALAMQYQPAEKSVPDLVLLANQFDGEDRWYLEALGIGATGKEQAVLDAWEKSGTNRDGKAGELIRWRLKKTPPEPVRLDAKTHVIDRWWILGPFDARNVDVLKAPLPPDANPAAIDVAAIFRGPSGRTLRWEQAAATPFEGAIADLKWLDFADHCQDRGFSGEKCAGYFATTLVSNVEQPGKLLVGSNDACRIWFNGEEVLSQTGSRDVRFADESVPVNFRRGNNALMVKLYQRTGRGGLMVAVAGDQQKPTQSDAPPGSASTDTTVAVAPSSAGDGMTTKDGQRLPPIDDLAQQVGDAKRGEAVFMNAAGANCISCHQIGDKGQMLGPPLTTVGQKLSKAQLHEAILKPSAGILMGFENWVVRNKRGQIYSGLKTGDTPDGGITIKDTAGKYHDIAANDVARKVQQKISIMPENLSQTMTQKELVDLVEYLATLKNK